MIGWLPRLAAGAARTACRTRPSRARRPAGDAGVTLIELVVAMGLMGTFLAMFTGAVLQTYGAVNRTEAITDSQAQITTAIAKLDKRVRYAAEISTPGTSGGYTYAEFFSTYSGTSQCNQLRLDPTSEQLKLRSWVLGTAPPAWNSTPVLVGHIDAMSFPAPRLASGYQQLRLRLSATSGGVAASSTKDTDVTFTALNSSSNNTNTSISSCVAQR